jgi:hypothetical protein
MTDHTPGPWHYEGPKDNIHVWSSPVNRVCFMTSDGPTEANARLISAAPDLLAVVLEIQEMGWTNLDHGHGMAVRRKALAAVQKAMMPYSQNPAPVPRALVSTPHMPDATKQEFD